MLERSLHAVKQRSSINTSVMIGKELGTEVTGMETESAVASIEAACEVISKLSLCTALRIQYS
jgi:hypothetical protein